MSRVPVIYTIGHSVHTEEAFLHLLQTHGIRQLADIRTVPASRRHPHFGKDRLRAFLAPHGIAYRHFPGLGGLRKARADSVNTGWRHESFRGYADYMQTHEFREAVCLLEDFARAVPTTVMCAEAVWWQCHRRILADALLVRGVSVQHILSAGAPKPHELSEFAREEQGEVTYPGLL
jgi:uncharacterized protein (DUF488 family)